MESDAIVPPRNRVRQITVELDQLFLRQIELTRSETLVGLTPAEREESEKVAKTISGLFRELARLK